MKVAIARDGSVVSGHFGHCEGFEIYNIAEGNIDTQEFVQNPGHRPGFLPVFLKEQMVDVIIAGGMGGTAQDLFRQNGIAVITGATGDLRGVIEKYIQNDLVSTGSVCHEHEHEHECHN